MNLGLFAEEAEFVWDAIKHYYKTLSPEVFAVLYKDVDLLNIMNQLSIIKEIGPSTIKEEK